MIGKYTFKQQGEVIAESNNVITTAGRKAIIDFLAGKIGTLAGAIAVGIGTSAATVGDSSLQFEFYRTPVQMSTPDYLAGGVVFKAQIPAEVSGTIYESGLQTLYDATSEFDSRILLDFNQDADLWSAGSYVATNSRLGSALQLTAAASATTTAALTGIAYDLSGFSATDQFTFVYRANNAFVASTGIRLKTDDANYYTYTIATPASGTYTFNTFNKSAMTATGTPDWSNITKAEVFVTSTAGGSGSIDFDGLRIEDRDSYREDNVLVSRTVLGTPVVVTFGIPLDIEYTITI